MPEHILSGIKAIVAIKMRKEGKLQREIAEYLKMERSIISHYIHGRYPSEKVMKVSEEIINLPAKYGIRLIDSLSDDKEITKKLIKSIYNIKIEVEDDKCIACGKCLECKYNAISADPNSVRVIIDQDKCVLCGKCIFRCPMNAFKTAESTGL
ncbi:MAG: 4Fe-4S ferredoxin [Methanothermococcus sp.]|jgi:4Fe-4S ferredoxin|uniref:4Fe-4S binding protein n=1 Tax=Methanothermococcus TaxID=155862 RepID=UPI00035CEC78|nr:MULTISPECIES: 4Fe-4S binding protein [Methanothermococcus]MDK2790720.1 4Fe-4S ferredoxin [Methanothermococcus sp.]MDK2987520.1 4Fe-4S ferredoxin [Methanothermococcus sp.]